MQQRIRIFSHPQIPRHVNRVPSKLGHWQRFGPQDPSFCKKTPVSKAARASLVRSYIFNILPCAMNLASFPSTFSGCCRMPTYGIPGIFFLPAPRLSLDRINCTPSKNQPQFLLCAVGGWNASLGVCISPFLCGIYGKDSPSCDLALSRPMSPRLRGHTWTSSHLAKEHCVCPLELFS